MVINIDKLTQLKQLPFNANTDNLIRVLCDIFDELNTTIDGITEELITSINFTNNTSDDGVYIQLTKESGETLDSPVLPIEVWETLDFIPFVFNGGNAQEGTGVSILRNNVTQYIESIRRKL